MLIKVQFTVNKKHLFLLIIFVQFNFSLMSLTPHIKNPLLVISYTNPYRVMLTGIASSTLLCSEEEGQGRIGQFVNITKPLSE